MDTSSVKVLLVEDSPSDADLLQEMVHQADSGRCEFIRVERLDEALARLRQETFDVLLLDLSLPDSSGPDTFLRARKAAPQLPVVVLTGTQDESIGLEAVRHGVQDYLVKGRADGLQVVRAIRYAIERKRMEEALRASEECFHTLFSSMTEGFALHEIICDGKGEPCDYRFLDVNPAFEQLTGLKREDVLGKTHNEVLPNDDPRLVKTYGAVALTGQPVRFENYSPALNKHFAVFAYRPVPRQVAVVSMDITERKQAEQAIRDREEELAAIYENAPLVMMLMDGERRVYKMNKQAEMFAGASGTDLLGRRGGEALRCLHAQDDPRGCGFGPRCQHCMVRRTVIDTFKTGRSHHRLEATLPFTVDGKPQDVTFLLSSSRLDVRGQPMVLVTMQDITARKQAEEALQRAHNELELRVQERTAELNTANIALQRANRALKALSGCSEVLVRAASEAELLNEICRIIVEVSGYRMAWVGFAEHDKKKTVRPVAKSGFEAGYLEKANITWANTSRGRGPTGTAIRTAQVVVNRDFLTDPRLALWRPDAIKRGYASSVALPLLDDNCCIMGALTIYATELEAFNPEELELLRELANDTSFGISTLRTRAERERLQAELLQISEREQARIGRDLHDSLGQQLTGISYLTGTLKEELAQHSQAQATKAARIGQLLNAAIEEVRMLSRGLHPIKPIEQGFMAALHELAATVRQQHKIPCRFDCTRPVLIDDDRIAINLYRIAQEAVRNAVVHGKPKYIWIQLHREHGRVQMVVKNNGKEFPPLPHQSKGMGLEIMKYRAEAIGASFEARRGDRGGTIVTCSWTDSGDGPKRTRRSR